MQMQTLCKYWAWAVLLILLCASRSAQAQGDCAACTSEMVTAGADCTDFAPDSGGARTCKCSDLKPCSECGSDETRQCWDPAVITGPGQTGRCSTCPEYAAYKSSCPAPCKGCTIIGSSCWDGSECRRCYCSDWKRCTECAAGEEAGCYDSATVRCSTCAAFTTQADCADRPCGACAPGLAGALLPCKDPTTGACRLCLDSDCKNFAPRCSTCLPDSPADTVCYIDDRSICSTCGKYNTCVKVTMPCSECGPNTWGQPCAMPLGDACNTCYQGMCEDPVNFKVACAQCAQQRPDLWQAPCIGSDLKCGRCVA